MGEIVAAMDTLFIAALLAAQVAFKRLFDIVKRGAVDKLQVGGASHLFHSRTIASRTQFTPVTVGIPTS